MCFCFSKFEVKAFVCFLVIAIRQKHGPSYVGFTFVSDFSQGLECIGGFIKGLGVSTPLAPKNLLLANVSSMQKLDMDTPKKSPKTLNTNEAMDWPKGKQARASKF